METNLYRKYRPRNFDQVVGQEVVITTLKNSIINETISHAYLFSGVRGTGKTSIAKIFARAINCQNNQTPLCGDCEICSEYENVVEIPDIFEIDAASNNGVDEIRKIIENIKYMPLKMKYKVYIIDEVHMLSKGAFNAILKTLEEPPAHAIFILATTEPNKIPVTILSRVQRFDFTRIDDKLMLDHLCNVLAKEQVEYEIDALKLIVRHAAGGLRDALSLLTKVISYERNVSVQNVGISLNLSTSTQSDELLMNIVDHNPEKVSVLFNDLITNGIDEIYLVNDLIVVAKEKLIFDLSGDNIYSAQYTKIITKLMETLANIKMISNSCLYIEITLIDLAIKREQIQKEQVKFAREPKTTQTLSESDKVKLAREKAKQIKQDKKIENQIDNDTQNKNELSNFEENNNVEINENNQENHKVANDDEAEVVAKLDDLFANKVTEGNQVSTIEEMSVQEDYSEINEQEIKSMQVDQAHIEDNAHRNKNEIARDKLYENESNDSKITNNVITDNDVVLTEENKSNERITLMDVLFSATKADKKIMMQVNNKVIDELNRNKKYGIAKFFELSVIQAASKTGIVVSIDEQLLATYDRRIDDIQKIYSQTLGSQIEVHLISNRYWQQERGNFIKAVKENCGVSIYEEAVNFFGKELVNKVNS